MTWLAIVALHTEENDKGSPGPEERRPCAVEAPRDARRGARERGDGPAPAHAQEAVPDARAAASRYAAFVC